MTELILKIDGMSCQHCVMRVKRAIESLDGVTDLTVEIGEAKMQFAESGIQQKDIENAVVKAGYKIKAD